MHFLFIFHLYISLINVNTLKKDASLLSSDRRKQGIRNKRSFAYTEVPQHRAFSMWGDKKGSCKHHSLQLPFVFCKINNLF